MGDLLGTAFSGKDRGGQPHRLPGLLKELGPEEAEQVRQILSATRDEVNWPALREEFYARGYTFSIGTWKRWQVDYHRDPERFGGSR